MTLNSEIELLRRFVRVRHHGKPSLNSALGSSKFDPSLRLDEPADTPMFEPSVEDFATGLITNYAVGTSLREWASVLLATGMIDVSSLEDHPRGEMLLAAIWDAAREQAIADEALEVARQLSAE